MFSPIIQKMLNDYAPLTAEEEKTATKDELVLHNIRYAATVVAEYTAKDRTDELMSAAIAGLQEAADR
jgi:DNA-directed RNA polymerase specialized sigma subunit